MAKGWTLLGVAVLVAVVLATVPTGREKLTVSFAPPLAGPRKLDVEESAAAAIRPGVLRRAKVWRPTDPAKFDFSSNPPDPAGTLSGPIVRCRFEPHEADGTTPKFRCVLPDGEVIKVKYGRRTGEIRAEIAATRLLSALGFGADAMYLVEHLRCYGCPPLPFEATWTLEHLGIDEVVAKRLPDDRYSDFKWVAVERRFPGREIEVGEQKGWAWYELDEIDPSVGAKRAEVDAFRLMAVFLGHWDNKAENQRLVCLSSTANNDCDKPFAIMQDLGATFGPNKIDLPHWRDTPIWSDAARCMVSMKSMPYGGATFVDRQISEGGRSLLARQLTALSREQTTTLFQAAHFNDTDSRGAAVGDWVEVFSDKVRQIKEAGPCPPST